MRVVVILATLLFWVWGVRADEVEESIRRAVSDISKNVIYDPSGSLNRLYGRLHNLEDGTYREKVSISYYGDSHIQADMLSAAFRRLMQNRFGDGGRGFISPLKLFRGKMITDYTLNSSQSWKYRVFASRNDSLEVGPSGVLITTEGGSVDFTINSPHSSFNQVVVLHHKRAPRLSVADSLVEGIFCPESYDNARRSTILLNREMTEVTLRGVRQGEESNLYNGFLLYNDRGGVVCNAIGVNGAAFTHYNRSREILYLSRELMPDLVIVFLGTNEAVSKPNMEQLVRQMSEFVDRVRRVNPHSAIVLVPPMDSRRRVKRNGVMVWSRMYVKDVRDAMEQTARSCGVAMWDFYGVAGGEGAYRGWTATKLMQGDNIHLTARGYKVHARLLYDALMQGFEQWKNSKEE